jgi:Flp pilus assembly protein TadG
MNRHLPRTRHVPRRPPRVGTSAIELVCVLPLLVLMAFAAIDLGRAVHDYAALSSAVRAGAERGATRKFTEFTRAAWEAEVRAAVREELEGALGPAATNAQISVVTDLGAGVLPWITVKGSYAFEPCVTWPGIGTALKLERQITIREFR